MRNCIGQFLKKKNEIQMKLYANLYLGFTLFAILIISGCTSSRKTTSSARVPQEFTPNSIYQIMKKVADWQIDSIQHKGWRHPELDWTNGALYAGLSSFAGIANDSSCNSLMKKVGEKFDWQLGKGKARYHADYYCVGQMYCRMYEINQDPHMIADLKLLADTLIARPHTESLVWKKDIGTREWAWCDALFMAPPSLAMLAHVTGEQKYLDLVDSLWWKTTDYLYDSKEHLYFRDGSFLQKKEKNGKKVFWSRGNGWVMGGLVRVLDNMPKDYPHRSRWIKLYQDMSAKIASLQQPDGTWHASLLDPESFPVKETSGTTFYCYALAWGVNNGILKAEKYTPVVRKAWKALVDCLHPNGMLGYVQRIGGAPGVVSYEDTEVYSVGAFLLAGTEVLKLELQQTPKLALITVKNTSINLRNDEMAEVLLKELPRVTKMVDKRSFVVTDVITGKELAYQLISHGNKEPQSLIFPVSLMPGTTHFYTINKGTPEKFIPKTYGRYVPERSDDIAWENNRIAFRMYGPALQKTGEISNGIDVWAKRTDSLIINKWYKAGTYHTDHGEGMDGYAVGRTLGDGGTAPYVNNKLWLANNYITYEIMDNGPLRTTFRLTYAPFDVAGQSVSEIKTISLDAGSQLNKIEDQYEWAGKNMPVAIGIIKHGKEGQLLTDNTHNIMGLWEIYGAKANGMIGLGSIIPVNNQKVTMDATGNYMLTITQYDKDLPFIYYQGAGWEKSGNFPNAQTWFNYLKSFEQKIKTPLKITVQ